MPGFILAEPPQQSAIHSCGYDEGLPCLPVLRWSDVAGGLTARTDGIIDYIVGMFSSIPNNVSGVFLSMGNNLWGATAHLVQITSGDSGAAIAAKFGPLANTFVGSIYSALTTEWTVLALGVALVAVSALWLVMRNQSRLAMRKCSALVVGLSLFLSMGALSANHPNDAAAGTPYWLTQTATNIVGTVGTGASHSLLMGMKDNGKAFATKSDSDNKSDTSCRRYTAQLDDEYSVSINGGSDLISTINTMWEETGLRMWARAQYGSGRNASNVFCRVLEFRAGAPASDMAHLTNLSAGHDIVSADAIAFHPSLAFIDDEGKQTEDTDPKDGVENGTYTKQMDRVVTMWQACGHFSDGWNVRNGWQFIGAIQGKNRGFDNATWKQMCAAVFTGSSSGDVYGATANGGRIGGQDPPDTAKSDTSTAAHDKSWNAVGTVASTKYTVTSASAQSQTSDKDKKGVLYSYAGVKPGGSTQADMMTITPNDKEYDKATGDSTHKNCGANATSTACVHVRPYVWNSSRGRWVEGSKPEKKPDTQTSQGVTRDADQYEICKATGKSECDLLKDPNVDYGEWNDPVAHVDLRTDTNRVNTTDEGKTIRKLIKKFDVRETSGWGALAATHNGGTDMQKQDAILSMQAQHGTSSISDVGGSLVFAASGLVNLMIWGVAFGLVSMLAQIAAYLLAAFGVWLGLLIYAFAPDKGQRAVSNALKQTLGCCCAKTLVNVVAAVCCVFITSMYQFLGLVNTNGNSAGTVMTAGVAAALLPIAFFKGLQYLCVHVWKLGDPLSVASIGSLMSGKFAFDGLKTVAGAAAGAIGARIGGGGLAAMAGAASRGARSGVVAGAAGGYQSGQSDAYFKARRSGQGGGPKGRADGGGSKADQAAGDSGRDENGFFDEAMPETELTDKEKADALTAKRKELEDAMSTTGPDGEPVPPSEEALDKAMDKTHDQALMDAAGAKAFKAKAREVGAALHAATAAADSTQLARDIKLANLKQSVKTGLRADGSKLSAGERAERLGRYMSSRTQRAVAAHRSNASARQAALSGAAHRVSGAARNVSNAAGNARADWAMRSAMARASGSGRVGAAARATAGSAAAGAANLARFARNADPTRNIRRGMAAGVSAPTESDVDAVAKSIRHAKTSYGFAHGGKETVARLRKENKPVKPAPEPKQSAPAEPVKPAPNAERLRREVQSRANARRNGPERMEDGRLKPPDLG